MKWRTSWKDVHRVRSLYTTQYATFSSRMLCSIHHSCPRMSYPRRYWWRFTHAIGCYLIWSWDGNFRTLDISSSYLLRTQRLVFAMVFYFTSNLVSPAAQIYVGKDKFESRSSAPPNRIASQNYRWRVDQIWAWCRRVVCTNFGQVEAHKLTIWPCRVGADISRIACGYANVRESFTLITSPARTYTTDCAKAKRGTQYPKKF